MPAPLCVETPRLVLSPPTAADADAIFARYAADPDVVRYVGWPRHTSVEDTRGFLAFSDAQWNAYGVGPYLIRSRTDGPLLGSTGLAVENTSRMPSLAPPRPLQAMTGYVLAKDAWGRGVATEALSAMVTLAPTIGAGRLYALCHPDHRASQHVLEKCGFQRDTSWTTRVVFPNLTPRVEQDVCCYARSV